MWITFKIPMAEREHSRCLTEKEQAIDKECLRQHLGWKLTPGLIT